MLPHIVSLLIALAAPPDDAPGAPGGSTILLHQCPIEYEQSSKLGAQAWGRLQDLYVKPGDRVKAGQVIGRQFDQDVRAEMAVHAAEADNKIGVKYQEAKADQARIRYKTSSALLERRAQNSVQVTLDQLDAKAAGLDAENAEFQRKLAALQLKQAEALAKSKEFVSPFDGVVVAVFKRVGEAIAPNEAVMHVVDTGSVEVTGSVDVVDLERVRTGQEVRISPEIGGADLEVEDRVFRGKITFVDSFVDPETQTFKVVARADNPEGVLRAGLKARMEIDPASVVKPVAAKDAPRSTQVSSRPGAAL